MTSIPFSYSCAKRAFLKRAQQTRRNSAQGHTCVLEIAQYIRHCGRVEALIDRGAERLGVVRYCFAAQLIEFGRIYSTNLESGKYLLATLQKAQPLRI